MRLTGKTLTLALIGCIAATGSALPFQQETDPQTGLPDGVPPPLPPREPSEDLGQYDSILGETDLPWGIAEELFEPLFRKAAVYRDYTRRFTCVETARLAEYGPGGEADKEKVRRYGYLLVKDELGDNGPRVPPGDRQGRLVQDGGGRRTKSRSRRPTRGSSCSAGSTSPTSPTARWATGSTVSTGSTRSSSRAACPSPTARTSGSGKASCSWTR